jgi:hypothetical protein
MKIVALVNMIFVTALLGMSIAAVRQELVFTVDGAKAVEITPERFSYIMGICTGRILVADLTASGYCIDLNFCLEYKSTLECYTDLKNGKIYNTWLGLLD